MIAYVDDAIHLATALLWNESENVELIMATHDRALAIAAEAHRLMAIGIEGQAEPNVRWVHL